MLKKLKNSKFYVHTALTEGMSNALLEAMSSTILCIILKHILNMSFLKWRKLFYFRDITETKFSKKVLEITKMKKIKLIH